MDSIGTGDGDGGVGLLSVARRLASARISVRRTMRRFAEEEIVLPTGPFEGQRFRVERQPWGGLWLDALDSGRWRRSALTGPSQAGKTLLGSAVPVMYHLFECRETVIYAAPTLEMAADKWREDVEPIIRASRYRELMPARGAGSRGGASTAIQFRHGPTLRFMSGGGDDKVRAGFTSRVAVITETDGMDEAGGSSREADKISQVEARTAAYGERARIYLECTVSIEQGRIWRELKEGTDSRILLPCPHCGKWITPEREQVVGWQDAGSIVEAGQKAELVCAACGATWSETERAEANRLGKLAHKGQSIDDSGTLIGLEPAANTLGFRFTTANNLLTTIALAAQEEWKAPRLGDPALGEKKIRQFWWAQPTEAEALTLTQLDAMAITRRVMDIPRGRVPIGAARLTIGIDIGKWLCHWVATSWAEDGTPHIVEYGRLEVPSMSMAEEVAILTALRRFRDEICVPGWPSIGDGKNVHPSLVLLDAGNQWEGVIVAFCRESGPGFLPAKGFGVGQIGRRKAMHDPGYELAPQPAGHSLVEINADAWKSYVHARLQTPPGQSGGITLFHATSIEHLTFAKHLTAEKKVEEFVAGRGLVTRWEAINRNNHYLDALALSCVAGHGAGIRLVTAKLPPAPAPPPPRPKPNADRNREDRRNLPWSRP